MKMNLSRTFGKIKFGFKKHSPEILVVAGVVGTVTSAVMACKATTKINDILYIKTDRHYLEIFLINGSVISVRDKISNYSDNPDFKDFVMIDTGILANLANIKIEHTTPYVFFSSECDF